MANFRLAPEVLLNGTPVPADEWSCDINAYSLSSALEAKLPMTPVKGFKTLPDFGAQMQTVRPYPFEIRCGISSTNAAPTPLVLEQGYVDERLSDYGGKYIEFHGRGTASIFQDIQVSKPINRSQAGDAIIRKFFADRGIPLTVTQGSTTYAGATSGDPVYAITMRERTIWDEMQAIALADGYRLTVHAGKGTYGPPQGDPALHYDWGRAKANGTGLTALSIRHSPRRSHNIRVDVRSKVPHSKRGVIGSYGHASATEGETLHFFVSGLHTRGEAQKRAQAIFYDVALREFLVDATIAPDEKFLQTVSQVGANFSIALGGDVAPSERLTYGVRQVRFDFKAGRGEAPLLAHLVMGNLNPLQEGSSLS